MQLRDFLYLDTQRLSDYLATLEPGEVQGLVVSDSHQVDDRQPLDVELGRAPVSNGRGEQRIDRTIAVSAKHSFGRLYDAIHDQIKQLGEADDLTALRRGSIIEIDSYFEHSPVSKMLESMFELMGMMQTINSPGLEAVQVQEMLSMMTVLFPNASRADGEVPMVSAPNSPVTCLFVADRNYLTREAADLEGEMSLVGKVNKVIPAGKSVDLLDTLNVLPRSLRRSGPATAQLRTGLTQLFTSWPTDLGGPITAEALTLRGPAVIVAPLAVFT